MGGFDISLFNGTYKNIIDDVADIAAKRGQHPGTDPAQQQAEGAQNARPPSAPADVADKIARLVKNFPVDKGAVTLDDLKSVKKAGLPKALKSAYAEATALVKDAQKSLNAVGKLTGNELADAFLIYGEGKTFKELKEQLQNDYDSLKGKIDPNTGEKLETLSNRTEEELETLPPETRREVETLKHLDMQIGDVEGKLRDLTDRWNTTRSFPKRKAQENWAAVDKAIADQENLSAKLLEMINAATDDTVKEMLETLMIRADSRASELSSLVLQMTELAKEKPNSLLQPQDDTQAHEEIKGRSAESLMADMSVAMHDNLDAAAVLVSDDSLGVNALVDNLEGLDRDASPLPAKAKDGKLSQADLLRQFREVEGSLNKLRTPAPVKKGPPVINPNAGKMDAPLARNLFEAVTAGRERINNKAKVTAQRKRTDLHARIFGNASETLSDIRRTYFWEHFAAKSPKLVAFGNALENLLTCSENLAKEPSSGNLKAFRKAKETFFDLTGLDRKNSKNAQDFEKELDNLLNKQTDDERMAFQDKFTEDAKKLPQEVRNYDFRFLTAITSDIDDPLDYLLGLFTLNHKDDKGNDLLVDELGQMERYASQMTDKTFESAFTQNGISGADFRHLILNQPLSGVIEAHVYGKDAPAEMFETECLDDFITKKEKLGAGNANTVWRVTYKLPDGRTEQRVFKDEISDYIGSNTLALAEGAWKSTHQMVKINYAAAETAKILGTPNAVTKVKAAMCEGSYGLLMDKAPGQSANDLGKSVPLNYSKPSDLRDLSPAAKILADIKKDGYNSNDQVQCSFVGSLAKGTCELAWNDLITGQGDRHAENYFVDTDLDGKAVVTGIDNDMCFPAYKTGLLTYHLEGANLKHFKEALLKWYEGPGGNTDEVKIAEILKDAGIRNSKSSLDITITDKTPANIRAALRRSLGIWSGAVLPPYISRTMRDNLLNKANQNQLRNLWKNTLDDAAYKAAVNRLEEIVSHVSKMDPENILDDDAWGNPEVINRIMSNPVTGGFSSNKHCTGAYEDALANSRSLLDRDFGDFIDDVI